MAAPVNEMRQRVIEAKRDLVKAQEASAAYLQKQAAGTVSAAEQGSVEASVAAVEAARRALLAREEELAAEEARIERTLQDEPAIRLGGGPVRGEEDHAPATVTLPTLSARTRRTLTALHGGHSYGAQSEDRFRSILAAALGGVPLPPGLIKAAAGGEYSDPDGGFATTPDVAQGIFVRAAEQSLWMRLGFRVEQMTTSERDVVAFDDDDETDDAEASIKAGQIPETVAATAQWAKLRRVHLKADKLMILAAASNELSEDAPDYVPALEAALTRAIAKKFDRLALTHTVLDGPATITVAKEGAQAADTILWQNVTKMWAALAPGSHENSVWIASPTTLPQLLSLSLPIGTGGTQPRGVFETGGPTGYQMLTRPVYISSRVKPLGDKGDLMLVDPSQGVIGIRRGISIQRSAHALFSSDSLAVRASFRGCAGSLWETKRTLVDGSFASPFVVLEAR